MSEILGTVLPIFALIALGFGAGWIGLVDDTTSKGLANFTFMMAIPAMLFRAMATAQFPDVAPTAVWAGYFGTVLTIWLIAAVFAWAVLRRPLADGAPIAMSAGFGNVVMVGIPLASAALGDEAAGPIALIISAHSPVLWTIASLHLALIGAERSEPLATTLTHVAKDLARNPIILAIIAGTLWRLTGIGLHDLADQTLLLLGRAAIPCALVSLGLSLIGFRIAGQVPTLGMILLLKLALMPVVAWFVTRDIIGLPPLVAGVIILFAATPTGANAYLFARQHGRAVNSASAAVALGTALSVITATVTLLVLRAN